ncbi:MAG: TIGR03546 family protein [Arcobacteraceae bacterium]
MFTIKKIWKALNHAGKPWQISLAISLGMIVGLTPFISLHNVVIIIAVLLLNIHVGIFILAMSVFGTLGLIFDPIFASVGSSVLHSEELQMIFTQMYNNPIGNLSGFNNTIFMGSFVISLLLFPFVYVLSSFLLIKYRTIIATKIQNIPLLNKLQFFKNEEKKQIKTFRLAGILVLLFIIAVLFLFKIFILDAIIKTSIEKSVSKASDKMVTIESLSTSIFASSIELENVFVSDLKDPSDNMKIENIVFDIHLSQLIFKRLIVDNIIVDKISFPDTNKIALKEKSTEETSNVKTKETSGSDIDALTSLKNIDVAKIQNEFDKDYKAEFTKYKQYYEQIKPLFNSEKKIKEERAEGLFVYFDLDSTLPELLIKKGTFSLIRNDSTISGIFSDLTNNQYLHKKPFVIMIETSTNSFKSLNAELSILETEKKSIDSLDLKLKEYIVKPMSKKGVSISNTTIDTNLALKVDNKIDLDGYETIDVLSTDIAFPESNKYITILNESLVKTQGINAKVNISGKINNPSISINSNLDTVLKEKVKEVLYSQEENIKNELKEKAKSKIKDKLDEKLDGKLKGILGF